MPPYHALLRGQLKRHLGGGQPVPESWQPLLDAVSAAYEEFDLDRRMLERALELSSKELFQANTELRGVLQTLPDILFRIDAQGKCDRSRRKPGGRTRPPAKFTGRAAALGFTNGTVPGSRSSRCVRTTQDRALSTPSGGARQSGSTKRG